MPRIIKLTGLAFIMLLSFGCKDKQNGVIPYVPVNTSVGLGLPTSANLAPIGGWIYVDGFGSKGLIVYHKDFDEYVTYDRNCTFEGFGDCVTLHVDASLGQTKDDCCGSTFSLQTGLVLHGPATYAMIQYHTELQGNTLYITN